MFRKFYRNVKRTKLLMIWKRTSRLDGSISVPYSNSLSLETIIKLSRYSCWTRSLPSAFTRLNLNLIRIRILTKRVRTSSKAQTRSSTGLHICQSMTARSILSVMKIAFLETWKFLLMTLSSKVKSPCIESSFSDATEKSSGIGSASLQLCDESKDSNLSGHDWLNSANTLN